jgi:hypothetical protein
MPIGQERGLNICLFGFFSVILRPENEFKVNGTGNSRLFG